MSAPIETEIKLAATPAMLDALRSHPALAGEDVAHCLVNIWFDTPAGDLNRAGATLRIRDTGHGREQTLKLPPRGGLSRVEWTVPTAGKLPEPAAFPPRAQRQLARLIGEAPLHVIASAEVERHERTVHWQSATIAVAFDCGTITAGNRHEAICELELELAGGPLSDALALACELPLGPELTWSGRSKASRAFALAHGDPEPTGAPKPRLRPDMTPGAGFHAIGWSVLGQLLAAYPQVLADGSPVGIHQSRVALRRLRSAIRLFAPAIRDDQMPALKAALGTAARGLGKARDLYVLAETTANAAGDDADAGAILTHLVQKLAEATADSQSVLASAPFQRLLFELAIWLENGDHRKQPDQAAGADLRRFAARALSRSRRRLLRHGLEVSALDEETRHEVRKDAKQLRYAVGFLEPLRSGSALRKHQSRFARDLARLQDTLGALNDRAVAAASQRELFADLDPITAARMAARLESLLAGGDMSERKLLRRADKLLERIAAAHPWWKRH